MQSALPPRTGHEHWPLLHFCAAEQMVDPHLLLPAMSTPEYFSLAADGPSPPSSKMVAVLPK